MIIIKINVPRYHKNISHLHLHQLFYLPYLPKLTQLACFLFVLYIPIDFKLLLYQPIQQSQSFSLISIRICLVLPLYHEDYVWRSIDDFLHAQEGLHLHLLYVHQHEIDYDMILYNIVDQIQQNLFFNHISLRQAFRDILQIHLRTSCVLLTYDDMSFALNIASSYSKETGDVLQVIQIDILFDYAIRYTIGLYYVQLTFISYDFTYDNCFQAGL